MVGSQHQSHFYGGNLPIVLVRQPSIPVDFSNWRTCRNFGAIMKRKILSVLEAAASVGLFQSALAADMPVKAPIHRAAPAAVANWTGCYVGGNVGYGWVPTTWSDNGVEFASHTADGVVGGGDSLAAITRAGGGCLAYKECSMPLA